MARVTMPTHKKVVELLQDKWCPKGMNAYRFVSLGKSVARQHQQWRYMSNFTRLLARRPRSAYHPARNVALCYTNKITWLQTDSPTNGENEWMHVMRLPPKQQS
ncbi:hypothetical protein CBL_10423 [Carabus blaptoides fortunei]